jgi:MoaA/NifB/PqqE/SkfB family radical SAM enzyme
MLQWKTRLKFAGEFLRRKPEALAFFIPFLWGNAIRGRNYSRDDGFSAPPSVVTFAVTDYCNLNCKMCPFQRSDIKKNHLDFGLIRKLLDQLYPFKPYISLCGRGEPFMHPQFFEIVSYIKSKGLWCGVDTNGTLIEKNVDKLLNSKIDIVNVSIDSVGEIQDKIRGVPGAFQKAIDGIKALRAKAPKFRPMIRINCVISGYSFEHLGEVYELAKDVGVDILNLCHSFYVRTEKMLRAQEKLCRNLPQPNEKISWDTVDIDAGSIDYKELATTIDRLRRKDEGVIVTVLPDLPDCEILQRYYSFKGFIDKKTAKCAWKHTNIYPNGDVEMCDGLYPMGNLNDSDFLEIWNNENFREFRREIKKRKRFPICSACCRYYHYS